MRPQLLIEEDEKMVGKELLDLKTSEYLQNKERTISPTSEPWPPGRADLLQGPTSCRGAAGNPQVGQDPKP